MLDEQGEQLERIEEGADKINKEMQEAEKNLAGMEACCGLCVLPWNKAKGIEDDEEYKKTWKKNDGGTKLAADGPRRVVGDAGPAGKGYILRITNDAREDEMDENLVQVSSMIGNLRNMAIDMNTELETQNNLIARVEKKVITFFYISLFILAQLFKSLLTRLDKIKKFKTTSNHIFHFFFMYYLDRIQYKKSRGR